MLQKMTKRFGLFMIMVAVVLTGFIVPALAADKVLTFGLTPTEDAEAILRNAKPTVEFLTKKLNMPVKSYITTDYSGIIEAFRAKKLDVARIGSLTYVLSSKLASIEPFMVEISAKYNSATYRCIFITHSDSGIYSVGDLKGKTFAFVDPASTSGHLIPRVVFKKWGVDPEKDIKKIFYSGSHDSSCMAVKNKKVDAAAISEGRLYDLWKKGYAKPEEFRIFLWSDPVPMSPYVYRSDLPEEMKEKIKAAFKKIPIDTYKSYRKAAGFMEADDSMFDAVRQAADIVGLKYGKKK